MLGSKRRSPSSASGMKAEPDSLKIKLLCRSSPKFVAFSCELSARTRRPIPEDGQQDVMTNTRRSDLW